MSLKQKKDQETASRIEKEEKLFFHQKEDKIKREFKKEISVSEMAKKMAHLFLEMEKETEEKP